MPGSNERHVLAILRRTLHLTQKQLAELAGCKPPTVQAIELLKLKLSPKLAAKIALSTGCDLAWLERNNIDEVMPAIQIPQPNLDPKKQAYGRTILVLQVGFAWLTAIAIRQPKELGRAALELFLGLLLDNLKKAGCDPKAQPGVQTRAFDFLLEHPDLIDPDLGKVLNLPALAADQAARFEEMSSRPKSRGPKFTPRRPDGQQPAKQVLAKGSPSRERKKRSRSR